MTARILVVDDIPANVRLLQARLVAEYFEVLTAFNGEQALEICEKERVDVILLDIMMPGIDGFEVCRRLKAQRHTSHIPVVMVTALDQQADRIKGLEAGADDFLTKPVNDLQLMSRVKSLVRLKSLSDELHLRASTRTNIGLETLLNSSNDLLTNAPADILIIDENRSSSNRLASAISSFSKSEICFDPKAECSKIDTFQGDLILVSTGFRSVDPLRICSHIRSIDATRFTPIMLVAEDDEENLVMRALELGVNDYVIRPVDPQELQARIKTQVRRKRYNDNLRSDVTASMEMAVTDPLTGLQNRYYLDNHLEVLFRRSVTRNRPLSVLMSDLDCFKAVNDTHGHDAGDAVLREFARRLRANVRGIDLACRYGGEEFVIVMPDTGTHVAEIIAERLRWEIEQEPFPIGDGKTLDLTVSIGVSAAFGKEDSVKGLLKRADEALYIAKGAGRNRVVAKAA